jgi:flavin reductase (DIM6/NTAB) family NADH-FMN oxidoreductase RutF
VRPQYSLPMPADTPHREYRSGSDQRTLRDALGSFATGVTVVTCVDADGQPFGLTVNSFTSVSLDPPLLLACIASNARCAPALAQARFFAVNVLQTGQQPASIRFSTRDEDRFGTTPWSTGETGAPLLMDSLAVFECERHAVHEGGDHYMLTGQVVRASFDPTVDPLLYFRGSYRRLHFD